MEDFSVLVRAVNKPYVYWQLGGTDRTESEEANRQGKLDELIPSNHSPFLAPAVGRTLVTGADAMVAAALAFLV